MRMSPCKAARLIFAVAASLAGGSTDVVRGEAGPHVIRLDDRDQGRTFEGLGALSAGASSRLLMEYPEAQRSQILDLLFLPRFGAGFQHLKVEVGGDVNSTDGIEPSHARTREEFLNPRPEHFRRGYEWWLMREAKARNPQIRLDILQWGAPGWIGEKGDDRRKFFSQDNADFLVSFIQGAKREHGLTIDYCGIWNETPHDLAWIKTLRRTLDRHELANVGIVASDQVGNDPWRIAREMLDDPELMKSVRVVGAHYPKTQSTPEALQTGKPVWSSEDGPWRGDWEGARALAKAFNRNFIQGRMTKTIIWSLVSSYYPTLPLPDSGPMKAREPWSGHFEVQPALWTIAHSTQFADPGWIYLERGCGMLGADASVVCLREPAPGGDFSLIIETVDAQAPQRVEIRPEGGLSAPVLHVWRTDATRQFERQTDLKAADGAFTTTLDPGAIYSMTTRDGQRKGVTNSPPARGFPLPHEDGFEAYAAGSTARYFADQGGLFEVARRPEGAGNCLRQVIGEKGIDWPFHPTPEPYSLIGSPGWKDYEVAAEVRVEGAGAATLLGRVVSSPQSAEPAKGYGFEVQTDGRWRLQAFTRTLASGTTRFAADRWHCIQLLMRGTRIEASLDGAQVTAVTDSTFDHGMAGIGTGWNHAAFDNFAVRPAGPVGKP